MTGHISHVAVVVPVHDEEELLGTCLRSITASLEDLRGSHRNITGSVVAVLDSCTDGSAAIVASVVATRLVTTRASRVGAARAAGIRSVLAGAPEPTRVWLANTDADTVVPLHWLSRQVDLAAQGADVVIGTVAPSSPASSSRAREWWARHRLEENHPYLHGANLGVRASAYLAAGGFADLACHEDVALVAALRATGATCVATDTTRVSTSDRLVGRAPGGFADFLTTLAVPSP